MCVCVCKDWIWIGPSIKLSFSPTNPNNEFVERGWKNWIYSRRKTIKVADLRSLNTNKIRKSVLGTAWGAYVIMSCSSTKLQEFTVLLQRFLFPHPALLGHLPILYTTILVSFLPYTCRLDSRNSFLSHPTSPRIIN